MKIEQFKNLSITEQKDLYDSLTKCLDYSKALEILKEKNIELSETELKKIVRRELNEEELENITGGTDWYKLTYWTDKNKVQFLFKVGDYCEVASGWIFGTVRCRITQISVATKAVALNDGTQLYCDMYYCEAVDDEWYFYNGWKSRDLIEVK